MATAVQDRSALRRRAELADFLLTRRARLAPADVGLPSGRRRRVAGLRREEVAELAGISATWYTWMEQGRAVRVSVETLDRLANVLSLDGREREHLFLLAGHAAPPAPSEGSQQAIALVRQTLDSLNPNPAYLLNQRWDILAWNRAATGVFGDFSAIEESQRNVVWLTFQRDSSFGKLFVDWDRYARCVLGSFRADSSAHVGDPRWSALTGALIAESPVFADLWPNHEVAAPMMYRKELRHETAGLLTFEPLHLHVPAPSGLKIVVYLPCGDTDTPEKLRQLDRP